MTAPEKPEGNNGKDAFKIRKRRTDKLILSRNQLRNYTRRSRRAPYPQMPESSHLILLPVLVLGINAVGELYIGAYLNGYTVAGQQLSAAAAQDTACGTDQYVAVLGFHTKFSADPGQHDAR